MVAEEILMIGELLMCRYQKTCYVMLAQSAIQGSTENDITRPVSAVGPGEVSPCRKMDERVDHFKHSRGLILYCALNALEKWLKQE